MVPGTQAHTHDGRRQAPRDRPDIRAQLTGPFASADRRLVQGTNAVLNDRKESCTEANSTSPCMTRASLTPSPPATMAATVDRDARQDQRGHGAVSELAPAK